MKFGLSEEKRIEMIEKIDRLERMAKIPLQINKPRKTINEIPNIEQIMQNEKNENKRVAEKGINNAYIYDDRFIWIDLDDFNAQREVTNILYKMGKYVDKVYNNVVVASTDKMNNKRLVFFGKRELIDELYDEMKEFKIRWTGGEPESGFFGIQISEGEDYKKAVDHMRFFLEEKILKYHRIVKPEDIIKSEEKKYGNNVVVHQIANPKTFYDAIKASHDKEHNDHYQFVDLQSIDDYKDKDSLFLVNAGCAGCAISKDKNIESVFKNDSMAKSDQIEKISSALLCTAIENGGKKLDCFDGFLTKNYIKHGFLPVCKVLFNDEFAPDGWNYERDGRPYIVFFIHNGKTVDEILTKKKRIEENKEEIKFDLDKIPTFGQDGYFEAGEFRDEVLKCVEEYLQSQKENNFSKDDIEKYIQELEKHEYLDNKEMLISSVKSILINQMEEQIGKNDENKEEH